MNATIAFAAATVRRALVGKVGDVVIVNRLALARVLAALDAAARPAALDAPAVIVAPARFHDPATCQAPICRAGRIAQ